MTNLIVVILAGGLGKRMKSTIPKVLHEVEGTPMIVRVIKQALMLQPFRILVVVGKYKNIIENKINEYIKNYSIEYINQEEALGTGHALQCCCPYLSGFPNTNTLILSGDVPLLKSYLMKQITNTVNKVNIITTVFNDADGYGRIIENNYGFVKIIEHKDCSEAQLQINKVNCGIYVINTKLLLQYLPLLKNNNNQQEYYLTDLISIIKTKEECDIKMYNIEYTNQYQLIGVNTREQLDNINKILLKGYSD
jgi:UDP-N-acetylglucosamine diphosphorylase/glucosamine-1-phosphate N-acetyltransferase